MPEANSPDYVRPSVIAVCYLIGYWHLLCFFSQSFDKKKIIICVYTCLCVINVCVFVCVMRIM